MSKKRQAIWIGQEDEAGTLLAAARDYIEAHNGKLVVLGPIELQHWPDDSRHTFRLAIRFTGKPPKQPTPQEAR